jgi:hypothetical protein
VRFGYRGGCALHVAADIRPVNKSRTVQYLRRIMMKW